MDDPRASNIEVCAEQEQAIKELCLATLVEECPDATPAELEEGLALVMPAVLAAARSLLVKSDVVTDVGTALRGVLIVKS